MIYNYKHLFPYRSHLSSKAEEFVEEPVVADIPEEGIGQEAGS